MRPRCDPEDAIPKMRSRRGCGPRPPPAPSCASPAGSVSGRARTKPRAARSSTHSVKVPVAHPLPNHTSAPALDLGCLSVQLISQPPKVSLSTEQTCSPSPSSSTQTADPRHRASPAAHRVRRARDLSNLYILWCPAKCRYSMWYSATTATVPRLPKPNRSTTLKYVQVPPTGGQEVSPRVFRGSPQVGPRRLGPEPTTGGGPDAIDAAGQRRRGGRS